VLVGALKAHDGNTRWEAAKALTQVRDASAAPALAEALTDEIAGVRWLAAEALSMIGRAALEPVLHGLMSHSGSAWYREGAHHVLKSFAETDLAPAVAPVLRALEQVEPAIGALVPTEKLLEALQLRA
jgi:HEAT repeat protein